MQRSLLPSIVIALTNSRHPKAQPPVLREVGPIPTSAIQPAGQRNGGHGGPAGVHHNRQPRPRGQELAAYALWVLDALSTGPLALASNFEKP
jgi:hypothetical protein